MGRLIYLVAALLLQSAPGVAQIERSMPMAPVMPAIPEPPVPSIPPVRQGLPPDEPPNTPEPLCQAHKEWNPHCCARYLERGITNCPTECFEWAC